MNETVSKIVNRLVELRVVNATVDEIAAVCAVFSDGGNHPAAATLRRALEIRGYQLGALTYDGNLFFWEAMEVTREEWAALKRTP
jgi:pyruvate/oxaloacetate carboxyltransferase